MAETWDKVKFVISDCHLSAGRYFQGKMNPHEDFHFDEEMCDLFEYFSTGKYGDGLDVELIIAGDYLDYLNVPYEGEFEDSITEQVAVYKTQAIIDGHPKVMKALRKFASLPGKKITYLIGNHDAELFFEQVRELITRTWDPDGQYPSEKVKLIADTDRIQYPEGVEIHHGNQFEPGNDLDFDKPFIRTFRGQKLLNIPWSSIYVLKIVNRLKWEREYIDKIRPVKMFVFFGLIFDTWFTIRFMFLSFYYMAKTRFVPGSLRRIRLKEVLATIKKETKYFQDLEEEARDHLNKNSHLKTIIMGHTHRPMDRIYPDGKQYINTGTWVKMIQVDWRGLGQSFRQTFALIRIKDGQAQCELRQWVGHHNPHQLFQG